MCCILRLFEKNKDLKRLFQNMTRTEADGELVLDEERLRAHSRIVMDGLGAAVESLEDSVILTNILIVMGERHAGYNVRPEMVSVSNKVESEEAENKKKGNIILTEPY